MLNKLEELKENLRECEKLRDEYLTGWQRAKADFLNYKKEEGDRMETIMNFMKAKWLSRMLTVHDDLERAKERTPKSLENNNWVKGVLQIEEQFHSFFEEQGIVRVDPKGEKFNPNFHEAVQEVEKEGKESGTIVKVLEKGYLLNGRLLRPAKVKVVK